MRCVVAGWVLLACVEVVLRHALVATGWGMTLLHSGGSPEALAPGAALVLLRVAVVATAPLAAAGTWLALTRPSRAPTAPDRPPGRAPSPRPG